MDFEVFTEGVVKELSLKTVSELDSGERASFEATEGKDFDSCSGNKMPFDLPFPSCSVGLPTSRPQSETHEGKGISGYSRILHIGFKQV